MLSWDETKKRILLLQLRRHRPVFYVSLNGALGQKRRRDSGRILEDIQQQIARGLADFRWSAVPRANMAVSMRFSTSQRQSPGIQNLVKFYMDELRKHAFHDDRQVACLEVELWRRSAKEESTGEDNVSIKVERLADYKRRFDATFELESEFGLRPDLKPDPVEELDPDLHIWETVMAAAVLSKWRERHALQKQANLLRLDGLNRIDMQDRPGLRRKRQLSGMVSELLSIVRPFTIAVADLPRVGETTSYKESIRRSVREWKARHKRVGMFEVPIVLDVAVSAKGRVVTKDLDNIMRDLAPIIVDELCGKSGYLQGYRVYVADIHQADLVTDSFRVRILPEHAIWDFERLSHDILDRARDRIELT